MRSEIRAQIATVAVGLFILAVGAQVVVALSLSDNKPAEGIQVMDPSQGYRSPTLAELTVTTNAPTPAPVVVADATATTAVTTTPALAEPDELTFEQPKDYTKLAVELEMNDVVETVGGKVPATGPAVPTTSP